MYEGFYQLHGKPFRLTPDAGMLFPSKGHKRALSYLLYGFEQGEGFVMITGAVGTGKTLLIQRLFNELAPRRIAKASIASANLDGEDILPAVAAEFGLPFEGRSKEALLQDIRRHLQGLRTSDIQALLVVDEAQTLTVTALEMLRILSNLEVDGQALLQVFLVGQNELRNNMVNHHLEQLRQRIIASYRLEPLDQEESRQYILHRLQQVGWNNDPEFDPALFARVHRASRGIPRKINQIMDRLLLFGYLEERHWLDGTALDTVLEEMRDELPDVPQTLEPDPDLPAQSLTAARPAPIVAKPVAAPAPSPAPAPTAGSVELERKCNEILMRLMREELRLQRLLRSDPFFDARFDEDPSDAMRTLRGRQDAP